MLANVESIKVEDAEDSVTTFWSEMIHYLNKACN